MSPQIYLIAAVDSHDGIGFEGQLPWHFKKELQHFSRVTKITEDPHKENVVIMGRSTWESLGEKYRPLPGRRNIVLTSRPDYQAEGAEVAGSMEMALELAMASRKSQGEQRETEKIFIIGGAKVFGEMIEDPLVAGLYLTRIHRRYQCDTFFPTVPEHFLKVEKLGEDEEKGVKFEYFLYRG